MDTTKVHQFLTDNRQAIINSGVGTIAGGFTAYGIQKKANRDNSGKLLSQQSYGKDYRYRKLRSPKDLIVDNTPFLPKKYKSNRYNLRQAAFDELESKGGYNPAAMTLGGALIGGLSANAVVAAGLNANIRHADKTSDKIRWNMNGQFSKFATPEAVRVAQKRANQQGLKTLTRLGTLAGVGTLVGVGAGIRDRSLSREYDRRAVRRAKEIEEEASFAFNRKALPSAGNSTSRLIYDLDNAETKENLIRSVGLLAAAPAAYLGVKEGYKVGKGIKEKIRDKNSRKTQKSV